MTDSSGFLAIDVGSSRVKLGWFPPIADCPSDKPAGNLPIAAPKLPQPDEMLSVSHADSAKLWSEIGAWLQTCCPDGPPGYMASVHPAASALLQEMFDNRLQSLTHGDLPLEVRVDQPDRVGIDRLLNAVAINRLRDLSRAAIVIDSGTACTVDLVAADGAFEGGAILPGVTLSAASLHSGTASLPALTMQELAAEPNPIGKSTSAAIASGLHWGLVGAVRELTSRMADGLEQPPHVFVTGGGATQLVTHLATDEQSIRHIPHLVLSGIALTVEAIS